MRIERIAGDRAHEARGVVIVIDVIRAFSVAAYACAGGARELWLVREVEHARALRERALRERAPDALLIGEVGGRLIPGFDHNNSPARMAQADVRGHLLIQCTGAGTLGAVSASNARHLLLAALVNARATAQLAALLTGNGPIGLLPTATFWERPVDVPNEDEVCASYIEALLCGESDPLADVAPGMERLRAAGRFEFFAADTPDAPLADIAAFSATDHFAFAMRGTPQTWHDIPYVAVRRMEVISVSSKLM
jgi:2-phosphosulfolactate phosphatase